MMTKVALLFCAQALLVQYISAQCMGPMYNGIADGMPWGPAPLAAPWAALPYAEAPLGTPCAAAFIPAASNGGAFPVRSVSPLAVTGLSVTSENAYEGPLAVTGAVPFLGAVALEGALPTAGAGAVTYGCGDGNVAMLSEDLNTYAAPYGYGYPGMPAYEAGIAAPRCGYNRGFGYGPMY